MNDKIVLYRGDLKDSDKSWILKSNGYVGIDTETTGLDPLCNSLCTIQMHSGGKTFIVRYDQLIKPNNIIDILANYNLVKIFHHATFDVRFLLKNLGMVKMENIVCTKIAAKLLYGVNVKNSLKELLQRHININLDKEQRLSDWSQAELTKEQLEYASNDVAFLEELWVYLEAELKNKKLIDYAHKCFDFLPTQAYLENLGINNIFHY